MNWTVVMILAGNFCLVWTDNKVNGTEQDTPKSDENPSGVCKADYNSKFNIDSKELGTTCVSKGRAVSKLMISNKIRHAMEKMKQDFQHLQDLIDQETQSVGEKEPVLSGNTDIWKGEALTVQRDYQNENKNAEKVAGYIEHNHDLSPPDDVSRGSNHGSVMNSRETYFGLAGTQDFEQKSLNPFSGSYSKDYGREEPQSFNYNSRGNYQQRILPNVSLYPEESYRSPFLNQQPEKSGKLTNGFDMNSSNPSY